MSRLMIGDLARRTGTKVNTVRFYEDIGLLPRPARLESGRRTYQESDVRRLSFIRHGRALGFSIEELRSLMKLSDEPDRDCGEAGAIARQHLVNVEERIARLEILRDELKKVATSCAGGRSSRCQVIELISEWAERE